jgi:hypothetical protein
MSNQPSFESTGLALCERQLSSILRPGSKKNEYKLDNLNRRAILSLELN